ncbi:SDR family oxidoreductase [Vibrio diazotrophicus]|uniref:SDR family oxidoreductase n=2 Tax=Vibrio diazotrophicus TaxID=685 RepID=UPI0005AB2AD2|nr:SDR family oxidoreductase [Vibrio diazotrophicus]PNH89763.1 SDR family oxidoreductase [Vibrio diazotrophicus]
MKTVLVTGINRGIGSEITKLLLEKGYRVLGLIRGNYTDSINHKNLAIYSIDLSNSNELEKLIFKIIVHSGHTVDFVINNAAIMKDSKLLDFNFHDFKQSLDVNTTAPYIISSMFVKEMLKNGKGRIINISSEWGAFDKGLQGPPLYSISKAALNALTVSLSKETFGEVEICSVCPGWVKTEMGGPDAPDLPRDAALEILNLLETKDRINGCFFQYGRKLNW